MSKIAIRLPDVAPHTPVLAALRSITGAAYSDLTQQLLPGQPVYETSITGKAQAHGVRQIRSLLSALENIGVEPHVFEDDRPITVTTLRNILSTAEETARDTEAADDDGHA